MPSCLCIAQDAGLRESKDGKEGKHSDGKGDAKAEAKPASTEKLESKAGDVVDVSNLGQYKIKIVQAIYGVPK